MKKYHDQCMLLCYTHSASSTAPPWPRTTGGWPWLRPVATVDCALSAPRHALGEARREGRSSSPLEAARFAVVLDAANDSLAPTAAPSAPPDCFATCEARVAATHTHTHTHTHAVFAFAVAVAAATPPMASVLPSLGAATAAFLRLAACERIHAATAFVIASAVTVAPPSEARRSIASCRRLAQTTYVVLGSVVSHSADRRNPRRRRTRYAT